MQQQQQNTQLGQKMETAVPSKLWYPCNRLCNVTSNRKLRQKLRNPCDLSKVVSVNHWLLRNYKNL